ncbi:hypothetical protein [Humibacter sp.]|jgi:hypothetical protein|uniref:bestrophin-like domain n=1 Tax=Humibacter sp. TaxID=1940291 RepID=UPI002C0AC92F|nr:hypothetical protein [Humibacter sp.]HVX07290.1 hypothetical protein [Humibacter sp.]
MSWFYSAPLYVSLPIFLIGFVAGSLALVLALRPWVRSVATQPKEWDRVLGYSIGTFGVFFGIFLALVAVAAYQNYDAVHTDVLQESSALGAVYRDVSGFPATDAVSLQEALRAYTRAVITEDWPLQHAGIAPADSSVTLLNFQHMLLHYRPSAQTSGLYTATVQQYNEFVTARRTRINVTSLGLPTLLWALIWVGAAVNAVLLACVDVKSLRIHLVMAGMLAVFIGLVIFVTADMDHPYMGDISVGPDDFSRLLHQVMGS